MLRNELLRLIEAAALPPLLKGRLCAAAAGGGPSSLKTGLRRAPEALLRRLEDLTGQAARLLGLPPEAALLASGYNPNDKAPGRLEAALAELRAALELGRLGCTGIGLLPQTAARGADLRASLDGKTFFFEVRCLLAGKSSPLEYLYSGGHPHPEAAPYLRQKYEKKLGQAAASRKRAAGSQAGVILVIEPLRTGLDQAALAALHKAIPTKPQTLLIITGD